jgi:hypothetical protein
MPRPPRLRLVARPDRRERVRKYPEHADGQLQERAATGRRRVCNAQQTASAGYQLYVR